MKAVQTLVELQAIWKSRACFRSARELWRLFAPTSRDLRQLVL